MKWSTLTTLPLVATTSAFVILDSQTAEQAFVTEHRETIPQKLAEKVDNSWALIETKVNDAVAFSSNAFDVAMNAASKAKSAFECHASMMKWDVQEWLDSATTAQDIDVFDHPDRPDHGHRPPPHHKPKPPHHPPPHHGPHKPNATVYELIASSKYTTKLAALINEYPELVETLNSTSNNWTVFAPTDKAFEKIPDHHGKKPPKELVLKVLQYHISPDFYPAGRVLVSHTIPSSLESSGLGGNFQRLRVGLGLKGLAVNFYSRIVAINIFGTNGVIHGVDSLLLPPPPALKIVELLPSEFSTLHLGLLKTGLFDTIASAPHTGGTFFAPSNFAFQKLGPRINAFLFSSYGEKYLKALLQYHIVANQTLYSDAFYKAEDAETEAQNIPKGYFHVDLPTLLEDKSLSIDIARWGGFITIKINGFSSVSVQDGIAQDGVIHVVSSLLIPPKTPGAVADEAEEMDLEDFKSRFGFEESEREDL